MARLTRAGVVGEAGREPAEVDEIAHGLNAGRTRPAKLLTLSPEAWERLDAIAERWGVSRSAAAERIVREAPMPHRLRGER